MPSTTILCCGLKRRSRAIKKAPSGTQTDKSHEALVHLGGVISLSEFQDAVVRSINIVLPNSHDVLIHFNPGHTTISNEHSVNNTNGWIKSGIAKKERLVLRSFEDWNKSDFKDLFKTSPNAQNKCGVVCPIFDENTDTVVALITFLSNEFSEEESQNFDRLHKQISVTFQRLNRLSQAQRILPSPLSTHTSPVTPTALSILDLCADLYDKDACLLQQKVIKYLKSKTNAEAAFLILKSTDTSEVFCQVLDNRILKEEYRVELEGSVFSFIMQAGKVLTLEDIPQDKLEDLKTFIGSLLKLESLMCVPIRSRESPDVIAIAFLVNKRDEPMFSLQDSKTVEECFRYAATVITSTIAFQNERKVKIHTQTMLQVAMNIFRKLGDLTVLLREIMQEARNLTKAERCSVFLLESETNELVAKVFDGLPTISEKEVERERVTLEDGSEIEQPMEIRIPANQGIAGFVATGGEMLNIIDAYSHPLFYRGVDEETGFRTRNILCFPIKDESGKVVGVAQLCNKINGTHFTSYDEDIAKAFSVYCCIALVHSLMYQRVQDAQHRNRLANELMTYHMQIAEERVEFMTHADILPSETFLPNFSSFQSIPRNIPDRESDQATVSMFKEMGMLTRWRIPRRTLVRFVLMVKRGYRDPPYHNWSHAFSVGHFAFLCIKRLPLSEHLSDLELLAFFVASLCHDIDHRGTNNSFQMASGSVLAALYSSEGSVLERHHFSQTLCILNTDGCNIFENMSRPDYYRVLDLLRDSILATDLAHHLRIIVNLRDMINVGYDVNNVDHHNLLLCLLMTSADLSDQTKNWRNTRLVAELIYKEFFRQGDLEKALGQNPNEQMDREKACVPDLQISFLTGIALPLYKMLADLYSDCEIMVENILQNRENWRILSAKVHSGRLSGNSDEIYRDADAEQKAEENSECDPF